MILTKEALERDVPNYKDVEYIEVSPIYTEIGKGAFRYLDNVREIKLPETITKIHEEAFWCCKKLEKINLPNGLTKLGSEAFRACESLKQIVIEQSHHDGTNYLVYRELKEGLSKKQIDNFLEKIYHNAFSGRDISRYTRKIGPEIGKVFGW